MAVQPHRAFLLLWNPAVFPWEGLAAEAAKLKRGTRIIDTWNVVSSDKYQRGDRLYIMKVGRGVHGMVGSGFFIEPNGKKSVRFKCDALLNPSVDELLVTEVLKGRFQNEFWSPYQSGTSLGQDAPKIEALWQSHLKSISHAPALYPDEIDGPEGYLEGKPGKTMVNTYERVPANVAACKAHYGTTCHVCGFDFGRAYGDIGRGFIHVHHLKSLSQIGKQHRVDPIKDLHPVCPNCHAMLHRNGHDKPPMPIESLRRRLRK